MRIVGSNPERRAFGAAVLMSAALLLGGCAVTPDPITKEERAEQMARDGRAMFADQEPLTGPLSLSEAMARALRYNLDHRLKLMEEAVARDQLELSQYDLLPKLTVDAGYAGRSNQSASSSRSVQTHRQSLEPSVSQDRERITGDLSFSWNILDFGVSYFNARQNADRALIAAERRRKVIHSLTQEVRFAFWKAAAAQRLQGAIEKAIVDAEQALANSQQVEQEGLRSPLDALRYQKSLLEILRQLEAMQMELAVGKTQLASYINLPPGTAFTLAVPDTHDLPPLRLTMSIAEMERAALLNNPDLMEQSYLSRISVDDTRKALLRLLPGLSVSLSRNYDSNSFLVNNHWNEAGARVAWNLMNVLSAPAAIRLAEANENVAETRRLAVSMAILSQIHIAYQQYLGAEKQFRRAQAQDSVESRIHRHVSNRSNQDALSQLEEVSASTAAIVAELNWYQSYSQLHGALGRIYATLGVNPLPETVEAHDIRSLSQAFEESQRLLETGSAGAVPPTDAVQPEGAVPVSAGDIDPAPIAAAPADQSAQDESIWSAVTRLFAAAEDGPATGETPQ